MDELYDLKNRMEQERPTPWEELPDIALYMDQLISYMPRQLIRFDEGVPLTSAMVNNYIKDGALPRAEGKRYSRTHLAYLTAICALKQVLCVKDAALLLAQAAQGREPQQLYDLFREELDHALDVTAGMLDCGAGEEELPRLALALALRSYADQLACERVLDLLAERAAAQAPEKRARRDHGKPSPDRPD